MAQSKATPPPQCGEPDARATSRTTVRRIGWLSRIKGEQVWDESDTGMRLVVSRPEEIPDTFYVYTQLDSASRRHCRIVWRTDQQIGVEFLAQRGCARPSGAADP
jgi:hypothetical protein